MKEVLLGITGSIAAIKIPELIRLLSEKDYKVTAIITKQAKNFITTTVLETLTERQVFTEDIYQKPNIAHINLARRGNLLIIAPATANFISKCAMGMADDLLSNLFLTFQGKKLIIPAMHTEMYTNKIIQENVNKLKRLGVEFLGPTTGKLSSNDYGIGRMVEPNLIKLKIQSLFLKKLALKEKKIIITAGGTEEELDSVRVITNKASGKLGETLAHIAAFNDADVTLITTQEIIENPNIREIIKVKTYDEFKSNLEKLLNSDNQTLFMTAAISDFISPKRDEKIKRGNKLVTEFQPTKDILKLLTCKNKNNQYIGFCLEDKNLIKIAKEKLKMKKIDIIIANNSKNIGAKERNMTIIKENGEEIKLEKLPVINVSHELLKLVK